MGLVPRPSTWKPFLARCGHLVDGETTYRSEQTLLRSFCCGTYICGRIPVLLSETRSKSAAVDAPRSTPLESRRRLCRGSTLIGCIRPYSRSKVAVPVPSHCIFKNDMVVFASWNEYVYVYGSLMHPYQPGSRQAGRGCAVQAGFLLRRHH